MKNTQKPTPLYQTLFSLSFLFIVITLFVVPFAIDNAEYHRILMENAERDPAVYQDIKQKAYETISFPWFVYFLAGLSIVFAVAGAVLATIGYIARVKHSKDNQADAVVPSSAPAVNAANDDTKPNSAPRTFDVNDINAAND